MVDTFNDFDPNGTSATVWAVWDGRTFYVKPKRGGCLTRVSNLSRAKLYELTPEGWVTHAVKDVEKEDDTCSMCGLVGVKDAYESSYRQHRLWRDTFRPSDAYCWERAGGSIVKPPKLHFLCPGCKGRTGWR